MRIAVVHYHLRPGGVTRVIRNTLAAPVGDPARTVLLTGSPGDEPNVGASPHVALPALDYTNGPPGAGAETLADSLEAAAAQALGGPPDVWHLHNHNLGRHPALTAAVALLARRGRRLLLHLHDFAEDGRPANFRLLSEALGPGLARAMYPDATHVHYAVLNSRDRGVLEAAGIPRDRAHLLPNPIAPMEPGDEPRAAPPLILYPTRAIRRKNIGEFLLWAALERGGRRYALTLAPTSPADMLPYAAWKKFAVRLPVSFEAGLQPGANYAGLVRSATALATTSVAEGFGLAFLEPWLAGRPLVGRDLPEITADLKEAGLRLPGLYERLDVPLAPAERASLRRRIADALAAAASAYGRPLAKDAGEIALADAIRGGAADFGRLDEELQRRVIERVATDPAQGPAGFDRAAGATDDAIVEHNRAIVEKVFSPARYRERLERAYAAAAGATPGRVGAHDGARVLDFFLDPARLRLLRT